MSCVKTNEVKVDLLSVIAQIDGGPRWLRIFKMFKQKKRKKKELI